MRGVLVQPDQVVSPLSAVLSSGVLAAQSVADEQIS
jgi:hypothetical protein